MVDPWKTYTVGFEDMVNKMQTMVKNSHSFPAYPPYNIVKVDENKYMVELALAGFSKTDIEIEVRENSLHISGKTKQDDLTQYLYKGIGNRAFKRTFELADTVEVQSSQFINGLLKIYLENIIPENKKPKKVEIQD